MLELLHIENIAVIEKADISFGPGLNVLTGETGAGKSIVIDALSAVTGGRTTRELVRTGAPGAAVTAVFTAQGVSRWCVENGVEPDEEGRLFLMRRITAEGKSTCRINGVPVTVAQLRELGGLLVDIHGQNDGRKLLDEGAHRACLDSFGGLEAALLDFTEAYRALRKKQGEIDGLTMDESEKERRLDTLRHQLNELEQGDIRPGELSEITARRELLKNASKLTGSLEDAATALYGGDDAPGAVALIGQAAQAAAAAARFSDGLAPLSGKLEELLYAAEDAAEVLRDVRADLEFSPDELERLEARYDILRRLTRKYGGSEEELTAYMEKCRQELDEIEFSTEKLQRLEKELEVLWQQALNRAAALSEKRRSAALAMEDRVTREPTGLNMAGVQFKVEFGPVSGPHGLGASGSDEIRFLMSANAGEAPGRLSHIASGGELSRIMLALKNVIAEHDDTATMVFDEVDAGVSGVAAQRVAEKLADLSKSRQVLCVTHLTPIAAMADVHFGIEKKTSGGRTFTYVGALDLAGRKKELARLIGGENVTETTLLSAMEQLDVSAAYKAGAGGQ